MKYSFKRWSEPLPYAAHKKADTPWLQYVRSIIRKSTWQRDLHLLLFVLHVENDQPDQGHDHDYLEIGEDPEVSQQSCGKKAIHDEITPHRRRILDTAGDDENAYILIVGSRRILPRNWRISCRSGH
jgi:hypothetical protein